MTGRHKKTKVIFRRYRTDPRTGKVLDARHYGLKAWPIEVGDDDDRQQTLGL